MGKKLELLVWHCTATPEGREVTSDEIKRWHTSPKSKGGRGWKQVGYTEMVHLDGRIEELVPYDDDQEVDLWEITNGASGINPIARHIVYVGGTDAKGKPKDTRTPQQKEAMAMYTKAHSTLQDWEVAGHYHFASKACPSFNVENWCREIGIPEHKIYKKK